MQVRVKNLKMVGSHGWNLMREGEAEKQVLDFASDWILFYSSSLMTFMHPVFCLSQGLIVTIIVNFTEAICCFSVDFSSS